MKLLISAVGDSDPIRYFQDGPLLHACRGFRPEMVLVLYSDSMYPYVDVIEKAILSIDDDYRPQIIAKGPISNQEVVGYNVAYMRVSAIVRDFLSNLSEDSELILNLSSGTPGLKNALFAVAVLEQWPYIAIQVSTPAKDSNANKTVENKGDLRDVNIREMTGDAELRPEECFTTHPSGKGRITVEMGEAYIRRINKRIVEGLLRNYDYAAVRELIAQERDFPNKTKLLTKLDQLLKEIHLQKIPDKLRIIKMAKSYPAVRQDQFRQALQYYRRLLIQAKRREFSDVIIKGLSLAIFLGQEFIALNGFEEYNPNTDQLYAVKTRCRIHNDESNLQADRFIDSFDYFSKINSLRNHLAHKLKSLPTKGISVANSYQGIEGLVDGIVDTLKNMLIELYGLDVVTHLSYYDDFNKEILSLI